MKWAISRIGGALLGALLGAVLGYEFFGFFLARAICPLLVGFNGWAYAVIDIMPGDGPALARLGRASAAATLLGSCLGVVLSAAIGAGQGDRVQECAVPSKKARSHD